MSYGHYGEPWRLRLQLTSASAVISKSAGVVLSRLVAQRATQRLCQEIGGKAEMRGLLRSPSGRNEALVSGSLQSFLDTSDKVVLIEWLV